MTYSKGNFKVCFKREDVANITVFKSWSLSQGRTPALSWDVYNYSRIELKDGTLLKISSLLVSELDKILKLENTHIRKTLFAWIT